MESLYRGDTVVGISRGREPCTTLALDDGLIQQQDGKQGNP